MITKIRRREVVSTSDSKNRKKGLAENSFHEIFIAKTVNKEDKVKLILGAFKDVHVCDWIATDRARLLKLSFEDFMLELHSNFLPSDWMETVRISLLSMSMMRNSRFWTFSQEVHTLNIVLRGTPSHLGETALCNQLEAGLKPSLQSECACEELYRITSLKDWIERVRRIDKCLTVKHKRYRDIFVEESNLHATKHPALGTSRIPNTSQNSNQSSSSSMQKPFICLPKLTDAEKDLLQAV